MSINNQSVLIHWYDLIIRVHIKMIIVPVSNTFPIQTTPVTVGYSNKPIQIGRGVNSRNYQNLFPVQFESTYSSSTSQSAPNQQVRNRPISTKSNPTSPIAIHKMYPQQQKSVPDYSRGQRGNQDLLELQDFILKWHIPTMQRKTVIHLNFVCQLDDGERCYLLEL